MLMYNTPAAAIRYAHEYISGISLWQSGERLCEDTWLPSTRVNFMSSQWYRGVVRDAR